MQEDFQQTIHSYNKSNQYPDIVSTDGIVNGSPRIANRLMSVRDVINVISNDISLQDVIDDYHLTLSQIRQALQYCSGLQCRKDQPHQFCHHCSLRKQQKGSLNISAFEEVTFANTTYVKGEDSLFLGTLNELLDEWNGKDWWTIATDLLIDYRKELFEETI